MQGMLPVVFVQKERDEDMRHDAKTERWTPMVIRGIHGYFNDLRIDRATVPDGFHFWELADGDSDGTPCRYKQGILVNFYGTFLTTEELPVDFPEWKEGFIGSDGEWCFPGGRSLSFDEMVRNGMERMAETQGRMQAYHGAAYDVQQISLKEQEMREI